MYLIYINVGGVDGGAKRVHVLFVGELVLLDEHLSVYLTQIILPEKEGDLR